MTIHHVHGQEGGTPVKTSSVLGKAQQPLLVVDREGTVLDVSVATAAIFGRPATSLLGQKCFELMRGTTQDASFSCSSRCPWLAMARTGGPAGPTRVTIFPSSRSRATLEFRLTHVPLLGLVEPVVVHLLEDVGQQTRQELVGRRLDSIRKRSGGVIEPLTARESDVLRLIARGFTSAQIASQLGVKVTTVRTHTARLFGKLGARSRIDALVRFLTGDLGSQR